MYVSLQYSYYVHVYVWGGNGAPVWRFGVAGENEREREKSIVWAAGMVFCLSVRCDIGIDLASVVCRRIDNMKTGFEK